MNKSVVLDSKSVFAPRGTATYTPKWSIVVLALACLGVLKFNGPGAKTSTGPETAVRDTIAAASLPAPMGTKSQLIAPPKISTTDTNSIGPARAARLLDNHKDENQ